MQKFELNEESIKELEYVLETLNDKILVLLGKYSRMDISGSIGKPTMAWTYTPTFRTVVYPSIQVEYTIGKNIHRGEFPYHGYADADVETLFKKIVAHFDSVRK